MVGSVLYRPVVGQAQAAQVAQVAQMTVGELYQFCTSSHQADKNACTFYILGVFEGLQIGGEAEQDKAGKFRFSKDKRFCVPDGLTSSAMELIVRMKMGGDLALFPQDRDLPAVSFITAVVSQQFPCHKPS